MARKGLGKGLGAIFGDDVVKESQEEQAKAKAAATGRKQEAEKKGGELMVKVGLLEPNSGQPRKSFDQEQLQELADSIKNYGVLQPLLVQKKGSFYEIIAGERRWRAAKLAGIREVPVVLREYDRQQAMEIALIENVQREDLNPIEEAEAYQRLVKEFGLTQEEIAVRVAKNRATIANSMRLLKLNEQVRAMVADGRLTNGHARALLALEDHEVQKQTALEVEKEGLSVRQTEKLVKKLLRMADGEEKKVQKKVEDALLLVYQNLEERMKTVMGTKVSIHNKDKNKGRIEIEYYSEAELERIVELIESIEQE